MDKKKLILLFCLFSSQLFAGAKWGDHDLSEENQISLKNAVSLASGVLQSPENLNLKLKKNCDEQESAKNIRDKICTKENIENLDHILQEDQNLTYEWMEKSYAKVAFKETEKNIDHINFVIGQIFQEMVNHAQLNTEDKKLLIKSMPIPEVRLLNQEGWNGYYQGESDNPPLRPKIYLKPTMIQNFSNPMISDYLMNTITHKLGHHFFFTLFGENVQSKLSSQSNSKIIDLTNCIDNTTISNEVIPGLNGELLNPNCVHVTSKRSELGTDFFASMANEFNFDFLPSWNKEKGSAYLCTFEGDYNSQLHSQESRKKGFKVSSHTEPISRIQTGLNPPKCIKSLWNPN